MMERICVDRFFCVEPASTDNGRRSTNAACRAASGRADATHCSMPFPSRWSWRRWREALVPAFCFFLDVSMPRGFLCSRGQVSRTLMYRPSGIAALVLPPFGDDCVGARGAHGSRYASYDMGAGIVPNILRRGARGSPRRRAYRALHRRI